MLQLLKDGEKAAGELAAPFGMSFAAVSQHLRVLKDAALVSERRHGRHRIYRLRPQPLKDVDRWIGEFQVLWNARLDALGEYLDRQRGAKRP